MAVVFFRLSVLIQIPISLLNKPDIKYFSICNYYKREQQFYILNRILELITFIYSLTANKTVIWIKQENRRFSCLQIKLFITGAPLKAMCDERKL